MFLIIVMVTALVTAYARPLPLKVRPSIFFGYPTPRILLARLWVSLTQLSYPLGSVFRELAQCP